ncbi:MAG TPA: DUF1059 domain-containing protein [Bacteroidota bacterium]|nr:DUF1059 domain-containing protein [Bacteroidota bacterium]
MTRNIRLATLIVVLFVCFSGVSSTQEMKKGESEMRKGAGELKSFSCDPACGFKIQSHDEQELTEIVIAHAKKAHNMEMTAKDVKAKIKTVREKKEKKIDS